METQPTTQNPELLQPQLMNNIDPLDSMYDATPEQVATEQPEAAAQQDTEVAERNFLGRVGEFVRDHTPRKVTAGLAAATIAVGGAVELGAKDTETATAAQQPTTQTLKAKKGGETKRGHYSEYKARTGVTRAITKNLTNLDGFPLTFFPPTEELLVKGNSRNFVVRPGSNHGIVTGKGKPCNKSEFGAGIKSVRVEETPADLSANDEQPYATDRIIKTVSCPKAHVGDNIQYFNRDTFQRSVDKSVGRAAAKRLGIKLKRVGSVKKVRIRSPKEAVRINYRRAGKRSLKSIRLVGNRAKNQRKRITYYK